MRDWILFGLTVAGFVAGSVGVWFGLAVKAAIAPLQERVSVLEAKMEEGRRRLDEQRTDANADRVELLSAMKEGFAALGDRLGTEVTRLDARLDRALNGKGTA